MSAIRRRPKKLKGKFKLDTKEDFEKGGESGAAVVPGMRRRAC